MRKRAMCLAAVLAACSDPAPAPQANVDGQQVERDCHDYASVAAAQVSACTTLAFEVRGRSVLTIEGLAENGKLHPLQEAFIEHGGFQCGFCTPGMILAAKALLDENPAPTEAELKHFMHGNICRCTGYKKIIESIMAAAKKMRKTS